MRTVLRNQRHTQAQNQSKREAMLELMLLTVLVDGSIRLDQELLIRHFVEKLDWKSGITVSFFIAQTTGKIRQCLGNPEEIRKLLMAIAQRLPTLEDRQSALQLTRDLLGLNAEFNARRSTFITEMKTILQQT